MILIEGSVRLWKDWWMGYDSAFHRFYENNAAGELIKRDMYRMNMAKKVCEDWASLLFNDSCTVKLSDSPGDEFVGRVLRDNDFFGEANRLTETAFALGTGAAILRLNNLVSRDGEIKACPMSSLSFDYTSAENIHPISVRNGRITEASFVSEAVVRGKKCVYDETHRLEGGEYVITNEFYEEENGEMVKKRDPTGMIPETIHTHSPYPFFFILKPNIAGDSPAGAGMGISVFADAVDCLKGVDLAFNNFCRDIKLGGKKVFMSRSLVQRDDRGNVLTPDDVAQQLFVTLGDGDIDEHPMITEHNPELRAAENAAAVQAQLNYLSFRCGLGTHHYAFDVDGRAKLTATQYMGERQDMRQNLVKHQKNARQYVVSAVRAILQCTALYWGLDVDVGCDIEVSFDDSYFADSMTVREAELGEVKAGVMTAEEFREKWIIGSNRK